MRPLHVGRGRRLQNDPLRLPVEQRGVHAVDTILALADDRDPGWIDVRERSQQIQRPQELVELHGFEGRARHHRLTLHVMQQIVVAEAAKILFERAAAAIQRLDNQDGAVAPLIALERLLVAPDWNALAVVHEQDGGQPDCGCASWREGNRSP